MATPSIPIASVSPVPVSGSPAKSNNCLKTTKTIFDIAQALFTISAIVVGALWYFEPEIKIDQTVTQRPLGGTPSEILISVEVKATNMGKTKVKLHGGTMEIRQINPIPGYEITEIPLTDLILEPGESDQALFRTVRLNRSTLTIQVSSRIPVPGTGEIWKLQSAVDIGETQAKKESATSSF